MINIKFPIIKQFANGYSIIFNKPIKDESKNHIQKMEIENGFLYALHGNNGIGKTTFMNILSLLTDSLFMPWKNKNGIFFGQSNMDASHIQVSNKSLERYQNLSFIFQDPHIINIYTIEENLKITNDSFNFDMHLDLIAAKVESLPLKDYSKQFVLKKLNKFKEERDNTPFYLSGGEKQLLSFIRCMIKPSNIIFADEPWASMDKYLKEFIESQLYSYIDDKDIFSDIRNINSTLLNKKMVIIISHPVHHANQSEQFGELIEDWTHYIPVSNKKVDTYDNLQQLVLNKYKVIKK